MGGELGTLEYHLTSCGDRREAIYEDDEDRQRFLAVLEEVTERYNWICHAYCLMTIHYHLLAAEQTCA
jgi:putative transposase